MLRRQIVSHHGHSGVGYVVSVKVCTTGPRQIPGNNTVGLNRQLDSYSTGPLFIEINVYFGPSLNATP